MRVSATSPVPRSTLVRDVTIAFALAIGASLFYRIAWPAAPGRDFSTYVYCYVDMWTSVPIYTMLMAYRTPLTPLFIGGLTELGGAAARRDRDDDVLRDRRRQHVSGGRVLAPAGRVACGRDTAPVPGICRLFPRDRQRHPVRQRVHGMGRGDLLAGQDSSFSIGSRSIRCLSRLAPPAWFETA